MPPALVISGTVVDAETKEPIKRFRVVPGWRHDQSDMSWSTRESFVASQGRYRVRHTTDRFAHLLRIEADGYRTAVSRDIKSHEGNVTIDFELKKSEGIGATVLTPDGAPAAGAKIALGVAGSQIRVESGEIDDRSTFCSRQDADEFGKFRFPNQDTDLQLVITHPSGYAYIKATDESPLPPTIRLQPWARVEGTFRVGRQPVANVPINVDIPTIHTSRGNVPYILFTHHDVTTGPGGRFAFERVFPGRGSIGRRITFAEDDGATEATSSCRIRTDFPAGKTGLVAAVATDRRRQGKGDGSRRVSSARRD